MIVGFQLIIVIPVVCKVALFTSWRSYIPAAFTNNFFTLKMSGTSTFHTTTATSVLSASESSRFDSDCVVIFPPSS